MILKTKQFIYYLAAGGMIFALLYLPLGYFSHSGYSFGFNASPSEKIGFYYTLPRSGELNSNTIYAFTLPKDNIAYKDGVVNDVTYLLKKVGAYPNEYLFTKNNIIYSCDSSTFSTSFGSSTPCKALGRCIDASVKGHHLQCQQWDGYKIPEGMYYMMSRRVKDSYDSRYFGLIQSSQIKRIAHFIGE